MTFSVKIHTLSKLYILGILWTVFSACTPPTTNFMRYTETTYPPTLHVKVLRTKPIENSYIELGELSVRLKKDTEENAVLYLKKKAMAIGADAIIIMGEVSGGSVAIPVGDIYAVVKKRYLKALAIRYQL